MNRGETNAVVAAIANASHDATGVRIQDIPMSSGAVLKTEVQAEKHGLHNG